MSLAGLLERQHQHLEALMQLLRREQELVLQPEVDGQALSDTALAKQVHLDSLEQLETQRRRGQVKLGYEDNLGGSEQAARSFHCLSLWQQIQETTRRAENLNQLNGTLIQQRLDHNWRVLASLREIAGNALYGVDGQSRRSGGNLSYKA